jgi:hypothetical protein
MKLKEFLENINEMVRKNPELLELNVAYSRDDEGNGFQEVIFSPTLGWLTEYNFESNDTALRDGNRNVDAICIN